ncbi:hypothetical protein [Streptomyces violaceus]|uniref:Uncharacterized protein n=1 Tax=Streptomyces violaceus TaxID=1936 RepID=A0ABY9UQU5_STRVL|nr:hypothetical protein [Streptomyces janthinus]WND24150.1 hypothetical protein RI060_43295 [Streptomyces janthinus]GGS96846.1 hypothetical protein GCM10010270_81030 [Streptomyces janthinus]
MTAEVLRSYRFRCDADQCEATRLSETNETPTGWSEVSSTAHQSYGPLPSVKSGRARLRVMSADGLRTLGRFRLHLCPDHPNALDAHLPRTDNPGGQGVTVSCSCGAYLSGNAGWDAKDIWSRHLSSVAGGER